MRVKTPQKLGALGEVLTARKFARYGFKSEALPIGYGYDVCIENTVKVEVKTARKGKDGKYNFTLWKANHANHAQTDYVVFIFMHTQIVFFIVPTYELTNVKKFSLNNPLTYKGRFAKYRLT